MTRGQDARGRALRFLRGHLAQGHTAPGELLPGAKRLARMAGVSHVTMLKALRRLAGEGVVTIKPGAGTVYQGEDVTVDAGKPAAKPYRAVTGWRRTLLQLRHDLLSGVLGDSGPLPSTKELCHRYGVCARTLRKALSALMDEGHLAPDRGRYRLVTPRSRGPRNAVLFVFRARPTGSLENMPPRSLELVRELERGCVLAELSLIHVPCDLRSVSGEMQWDETLTDAESGTLSNSVLGCVFWTIGFTPDNVRVLLARLAGFGKPIAVLDELALPRSLYAVAGQLVQVFSIATGESCGEDVGRYLLRKGHRHAAFIGVQAGLEWCQHRLEGFRRVFEAAPGASPVRVVAPPRLDAEDLLPFGPDSILTRDLDTRFRAAMIYAVQVYHRSLQDAVRRALRGPQVGPMLRRLLRDAEVTVWVGANDIMGLLCLELLRALDIDVPQRISLIAFDDTLESSFHQMTSYNFDYHGLTRRMLTHVCSSPHHGARGRRPDTVEITGFVNERRTTARTIADLGGSPGL
ncbi:MAG: GntR family transcriptional regulator [Chitinivibrionales bacterium]|nr:GntR family transcriptional regulator [Chitinivibrionales bacterium]